MYERLDRSKGNIIGIRVSGKLTEADYHRLAPWLEQKVRRHETLRVLALMEDFHGWDSLSAAWEDLKMDAYFNEYVERLAVVGNAEWERWMTRLSKPLAEGELRYFDRTRLDDAWAWLRDEAAATAS